MGVWVLFIYAVYVPILFAVYVTEIVTIRRYKHKFSSAFYSLFITKGVIDLINTVVYTFTSRLPHVPEVNSFYGSLTKAWYLTFIYTFIAYFGAVQGYLQVCISSNRLSAIAFPTIHHKLWTPRRTLIYCSIAFCVGTLTTWYLPFSPARFIRLVESNATMNSVHYAFGADTSNFPWLNNNVFILAAAGSAIGLSIVGYLVAFALLRTGYSQPAAERSLLLLGFFSAVVGTPVIVLHVLFAFFKKSLSSSLYFTLMSCIPWITDLNYLSPSILILLTDTNMRRTLKKIFKKTHTTSNGSIASLSKPNKVSYTPR